MHYSDTSLEKLFFHVARTHHRLATKLLEKHGIHRGQPPLLMALGHQDRRTNAELSDLLNVSPATITNMVKRMEKGGFVSRERDPEDERAIRVCLTDAGHDCCRELHETVTELYAIQFSDFTDDEKEQLQHMLEKMLKNLEGAMAVSS